MTEENKCKCTCEECGDECNPYYKRLEQELKWANDEEKYLKDCCIKAGKELEKHSFKWDGKEKNLVVQALQLNQLYEELEQENKELKEYSQRMENQRENYYKEYNNYRSALEEIRIYINKCRDSYCDSNCEYWDNCKGNYNINNILDKINEVLQ